MGKNAEDDKLINITDLKENTYLIASTRETTMTITSEEEREQKYLKLEKGNTELHLGSMSS